jgi:hypothetical protein
MTDVSFDRCPSLWAGDGGGGGAEAVGGLVNDKRSGVTEDCMVSSPLLRTG